MKILLVSFQLLPYEDELEDSQQPPREIELDHHNHRYYETARGSRTPPHEMEISYEEQTSLPPSPPHHYGGYRSKSPPRSAYSPSSPRAISPAPGAPVTPPLTPPLEDDEEQPYDLQYPPTPQESSYYERMNAPERRISFKKNKGRTTP